MRAARVVAVLLTLSTLVAAWSLPAGATFGMRRAGSNGHPTTPVWYHDSSIVQVGHKLFIGWNTSHSSVQARAFNLVKGTWSTRPVTVSATSLNCACTDSTGTDPHRHDVPSLLADPAGRVYAIYGGGSASHMGSKTGPFFRASSKLGSVGQWGPEQALSLPGAAYDFESVRDNQGVNHLVGQQGDNPGGAGSLIYFRLSPGTAGTPGAISAGQVLVSGGSQPLACSWIPGCNIFVIGRIALGPGNPADPSTPNPLYLTWGWSESNLSNGCGDPAGFCNRGLYLARSLDGGTTWTNQAGTTSVTPSVSPILYDDPAFEVVSSSQNVGLFKALAVAGSYPGHPWITFQAGANHGRGTIEVTHWSGSAWLTKVLDRSRAWNNHLVMRTTASGHIYLWSDIAQTGKLARRLAQWLWTGARWRKSYLNLGRSWFLTGVAVPGGEALEWRVPGTAVSSGVAFAVMPVR